jgi:hypothetical protein
MEDGISYKDIKVDNTYSVYIGPDAIEPILYKFNIDTLTGTVTYWHDRRSELESAKLTEASFLEKLQSELSKDLTKPYPPYSNFASINFTNKGPQDKDIHAGGQLLDNGMLRIVGYGSIYYALLYSDSDLPYSLVILPKDGLEGDPVSYNKCFFLTAAASGGSMSASSRKYRRNRSNARKRSIYRRNRSTRRRR